MVTEKNEKGRLHSWLHNWLESRSVFGGTQKFDLGTPKKLQDNLGNPEREFPSIHVAGTNGKGSTCVYVAKALEEAGYKVGTYLSPHVENFRERISINSKNISRKDLEKTLSMIKPEVERLDNLGIHASFFEVTTAVAMLFFSSQKVDIAAIETGLGGRLDATNLVKPVVTCITNVNRDHTQILGHKLSDIAMEKAGIVKENIPCITGAKGIALKVIKNIAEEKHSDLVVVGRDVTWNRVERTLKKQSFQIKTPDEEYWLSTRLLGKFQGENLSCSIGSLEKLKQAGFNLEKDSISKGIAKAWLPGRVEVLSEKPFVVLDSAHNPQGAEGLRETLIEDFMIEDFMIEDFNPENLVLLFGIFRDKNYKGVAKRILPLAEKVVCARPASPRGLDAEKLGKVARNIGEKEGMPKEVLVIPKSEDAFEHALSLMGERDMLLIFGSVLFAGEIRRIAMKKLKRELA
jgi:dihydrofolate synthase/folylpolyglutamate synthase